MARCQLDLIIWGLFHGFFLLLEEFVPFIKKLPKFIRRIYTLLAVTLGFVVFRADTISEALLFITQMFSGIDFSAGMMSFTIQAVTPYFIFMLLAAVLCCGPFAKLTERVSALENKEELTGPEHIVQGMSFVLAFLLLLWCIVRLAGGSYNPFIYFRF